MSEYDKEPVPLLAKIVDCAQRLGLTETDVTNALRLQLIEITDEEEFIRELSEYQRLHQEFIDTQPNDIRDLLQIAYNLLTASIRLQRNDPGYEWDIRDAQEYADNMGYTNTGTEIRALTQVPQPEDSQQL